MSPATEATSMTPSPVLVPGSRRRLLSGMRTKTILRPWAIRGGGQLWLCHGIAGDANRVYGHTAAQGREPPGSDLPGWEEEGYRPHPIARGYNL
jgi:hypothetical protein